MVKRLPAVWEPQVGSLGWDNSQSDPTYFTDRETEALRGHCTADGGAAV